MTSVKFVDRDDLFLSGSADKVNLIFGWFRISWIQIIIFHCLPVIVCFYHIIYVSNFYNLVNIGFKVVTVDLQRIRMNRNSGLTNLSENVFSGKWNQLLSYMCTVLSFLDNLFLFHVLGLVKLSINKLLHNILKTCREGFFLLFTR